MVENLLPYFKLISVFLYSECPDAAMLEGTTTQLQLQLTKKREEEIRKQLEREVESEDEC